MPGFALGEIDEVGRIPVHDEGGVMLDPGSGKEDAKIARVRFAAGVPMDTSCNDDGPAGGPGECASRTVFPHTGFRPWRTRAPSALLGSGFRAAALLLLFCLAVLVGPGPQVVQAQTLVKPDASTFSAVRAAGSGGTVCCVLCVPPVNTGPSIRGYEFKVAYIGRSYTTVPAGGGERTWALTEPWPAERAAHLWPQDTGGWGPLSYRRRQSLATSGPPVCSGVSWPRLQVVLRTGREDA